MASKFREEKVFIPSPLVAPDKSDIEELIPALTVIATCSDDFSDPFLLHVPLPSTCL